MIFKDGVPMRKVSGEDIVEEFVKEVELLRKEGFKAHNLAVDKPLVVRAEIVAHQGAGLHADAKADGVPGQDPREPDRVVMQGRGSDDASTPADRRPEHAAAGRPGQAGAVVIFWTCRAALAR